MYEYLGLSNKRKIYLLVFLFLAVGFTVFFSSNFVGINKSVSEVYADDVSTDSTFDINNANTSDVLRFSSSTEFSLKTANESKNWNGSLFYSIDCTNWNEWNGETIQSGTNSSSSKQWIYLYGINNTYITGSNGKNACWVLSGSNIECDGNAETLLDLSTVLSPAQPIMGSSCFSYLFYNCTSLVTAPALPAMTLADYCYQNMFQGCTSLTTAPALPAMTLANFCYTNMFSFCTSLTTAPALPATTLAAYCYQDMFQGCTSLTTAPELPATTLAKSCYSSMFNGCTSLIAVDDLPATNLSDWCYSLMFRNCSSLIKAPEISATIFPECCCWMMFSGCTKLTTAPNLQPIEVYYECFMEMFEDCKSLSTAPASLPAITLAGSCCYQYMFSNCSSLTIAPELPATNLSGWCYLGMFRGCKSLIETPKLPAMTLSSRCYKQMFQGCSSLKVVPELPAMILTESCYSEMFRGCSSITSAPDLPATTLAKSCYYFMFYQCYALTKAPSELPATTLCTSCYNEMFGECRKLSNAPELPAMTLADHCYQNMFYGCTSLTTAPALTATILADYCYQNMFQGCTSLTTAPALPATTLSDQCYYWMFYGCTSLTTAPALPATTLSDQCYYGMFSGCTSLTTAPALPATTLAEYCYFNMFSNSGVKFSTTKTDEYKYAYRLPVVGTLSSTIPDCALTSMFSGTKGIFTSAPSINMVYYTNSAPVGQVNITLDANGNSSEQLENGMSIAYYTLQTQSNGITFINGVTRNGYTLNGYYTSKTGGYKVINADGTLINSVSGWTGTDGRWLNSEQFSTLYAQWTPITYTITYYLTTTSNSWETNSVQYDSTYSMPSDVEEIEGYTFVGWSEDNDATAEWTNGTQTCAGNKSWYAVWSGDCVTSTDNWSNPTEFKTITATFNTGSGTTVSEQCGTIYSKYSYDIGYYDQNHSCDLTIHANSETNSNAKDTQYRMGTDGEWLNNVPELTITYNESNLSGYSFNGWTTSSTGISAEWTSGNKTISADTNYYAVWSNTITYTFNYDANGHGDNPNSTTGSTTQTYNYDLSVNGGAKEITITTAPYSAATGYTQTGWSTLADSQDGNYSSENTQYTVSTDKTEEITLYAIWTSNPYIITYYLTTTSNSWETNSVQYDSTYSMPSDVEEIEGYTFVGWSEDNDATAEWTNGTQTCAGNKSWYAVWSGDCVTSTDNWSNPTEFKTITATFNTGSGTSDSEQSGTIYSKYSYDTGYYNQNHSCDLTIHANSETNSNAKDTQYRMGTDGEWLNNVPELTIAYNESNLSGYSFNGWTTSSTGTSAGWTSGNKTISADTNYYAVWSNTITYTFNYDANGHGDNPNSTTGSAIQTYNYDLSVNGGAKEIIITTAPYLAATGYTQTGWSTLADSQDGNYSEENRQYVISLDMTDEILLYAIWEANVYKIDLMIDNSMAVLKDTEIYEKYGDNFYKDEGCKNLISRIEIPELKDKTIEFAGYEYNGNLLINEKGEIIAENTDITESIHLKLKTINKKYILTVDSNGGDLQNIEKEVRWGETIDLSKLSIPSKKLYKFVGWSTTEDSSGLIKGEQYKMSPKDVTIYAVYERDMMPVLFIAILLVLAIIILITILIIVKNKKRKKRKRKIYINNVKINQDN